MAAMNGSNQQRARGSMGARAATASWVLPVGGMFAMAIARGTGVAAVVQVVAAVGSLSIIFGLGLGILALCRVQKDGRKGVLVPACMGLGLSTLLMLSAVWGVSHAGAKTGHRLPEAGRSASP
jgi:hypothetical protein